MNKKSNIWLSPNVLLGVIVFAVLVGCAKEKYPPALTTIDVTEITYKSAKSGGNITNNGGSEIISKGIVWGTTESPSIEDNAGINEVEGTSSGIFYADLVNLEPNTNYFIRAWASNSNGVSYGNNIGFVTESIHVSIPGDAYIDLGDEFDPLANVEITGASIEEIEVQINPIFNNFEVNQYILTYSIADIILERNLFVKADKLAGNYIVTDYEEAYTYGPYIVTVLNTSEYNKIIFKHYLYEGIQVYAFVNGSEITIPLQTFFSGEISISGTGEYVGSEYRILQINYQINQVGSGVFNGVTEFSINKNNNNIYPNNRRIRLENDD